MHRTRCLSRHAVGGLFPCFIPGRQDESRSVEWGDTEASMASGIIEAGGATALLTVYGEVPRQPEVARGQYSDTVIATLYF